MSAVLADETSGAPLSAMMREGSRLEHTEAESSSFMAELLSGRVNQQGYADYLLRLRRVYAALEEVGHDLATTDPIVAAVHDESLERLAAIDADLELWAPGADGGVESDAADAYVARIEATRSWGGLYAAHHYTRYLGDLSGGQAIGRILDRDFELDGDGVAFYEFSEIPKPKPYKDGYRARLDALDLDPAEKLRVVEEVRVAFGLNQALFEELGARLESYRR
ncbi:heme oxygenase [Nocardioides luteus]|uniref:Heme oxygenase n=1 Tax=Nocardioides luteus TaxID=1844 RepID=A0ABQ5STQ1_9ACTN|nr:biliverdin-producing heme oxygenase [Nocardioides luteus]MDR7309116.1 heme oxygenase [Nocardioides luteus]GGR49700.1 putative heme oxygenase [Nocardioides luteus]GLJ67522.1 putative heme oxygenase [Nocardioides luteus]